MRIRSAQGVVFVAVVAVIIATYLLMISGSVAHLSGLKEKQEILL